MDTASAGKPLGQSLPLLAPHLHANSIPLQSPISPAALSSCSNNTPSLSFQPREPLLLLLLLDLLFYSVSATASWAFLYTYVIMQIVGRR